MNNRKDNCIFIVLLCCCLQLCLLSSAAMASFKPWFTGPLLAPSADTITIGHQNFQPYLFITDDVGFYNQNGRLTHQNTSQTISPSMLYTLGLTHFMDMQVTLPYDFNTRKNQFDSNISDISALLGFSILKDQRHSILPSIRFTVGETFPTGRYQNLNPRKLGTDSTGAGSYQTTFGIIMQKLLLMYGIHYLRIRLSALYSITASTKVHNFNAYGGGFGTNGTASPGNQATFDLAFEYNLTQNWVTAIDIYYLTVNKSYFSGNSGVTITGAPATVGLRTLDQFSLAPAIEYNFNADLGVIAGVWFSVFGRNADDFVSGVISLNYYH
jgi:hypothetical protein